MAPTAVIAQDVVAPCQLCSTDPATATQVDVPTVPVRLSVETSLDFDRLVLTGGEGGTAQLRPDGSTSTSGGLTTSGRGIVGLVTIQGEAGRLVRIDLPTGIALESASGGQILIDSLTTDLPAMPRLDAAGRLQFRFGGALQVVGDAEGNYRSDVPITVDYL